MRINWYEPHALTSTVPGGPLLWTVQASAQLWPRCTLPILQEGRAGIITETLQPRFQDSHNFKDTLLFSLKSTSTCQFLIGKTWSPQKAPWWLPTSPSALRSWAPGPALRIQICRWKDNGPWQLRVLGGWEASGFLVWLVGDLGSTSPFLSPIGHHCPIPTLKWKRKLHPRSSVVPFLVCTLESLKETKKIYACTALQNN